MEEQDHFQTAQNEDVVMTETDSWILDNPHSHISFGDSFVPVYEMTDEIVAKLTDEEYDKYFQAVISLLPHPL